MTNYWRRKKRKGWILLMAVIVMVFCFASVIVACKSVEWNSQGWFHVAENEKPSEVAHPNGN